MGAERATLGARIFSDVVLMVLLRKLEQLLAVEIPRDIENGMFQFGKLAIQSTLGTVAIAAQAMTNIQGIFLGLGWATRGECPAELEKEREQR